MPVLASRGCPFSCTFCTSPQMWGTSLYLRDPKSVVEEIRQLYSVYGIDHVDMIDLVGFIKPTWTKELLNELIKADLPVTWLHGAGTRSEVMSEEILDLIKASKAARIHYAPETGSKSTIEKIGKKIDLDILLAKIRYTH